MATTRLNEPFSGYIACQAKNKNFLSSIKIWLIIRESGYYSDLKLTFN